MSTDLWNRRLVTVTGGASFIGSALTKALLERGAVVRVVDNFSTGRQANLAAVERHPRLTVQLGDLRDAWDAQRAIDGAEVVFHLAADHGGRGYIDTHQAACAGNLLLDGQVFRACRNANVPQIVFASSGCVYPMALQQNPQQEIYLTEDLVAPPYDADNLYGWAKLMGELTLQAFAREWGMGTASCRYFTVYGPRAKPDHAMMALIDRALRREDPYLVWGDGTQVRNWTYISDIVEGTILAAERIHDGTAVNLGTEERTTVGEAAQMILRQLHPGVPITYRPDAPVGPRNRVASNQLAKALLGWTPQVPLAEGLRRTIAWAQTQGGLQ